MSEGTITYSSSGVDIEAGDQLMTRSIAPIAAATKRPGVIGALGGFGALFDLSAVGMKDPILVSGTDGVGTKLLAGIQSGFLDGLGQDLVAMCVNDLICQGAKPLFFLDYFATGKLDTKVAERVIASIAEACRVSDCALVGGETAEMPQMYTEGHFDLAGFAVGAVERDAILPKLDDMREGMRLVGWASNGVHSNGFSLVRKILEVRHLDWRAMAPWVAESKQSVAESLMVPTRLYVKTALDNLDKVLGYCHITGGGLPGNVGRMLPNHLAAEIDLSHWKRPGFFQWVLDEGLVEQAEAYRVFNMGVGLVAVLKDGQDVPEGSVIIGRLINRDGEEPCKLIG